MTDKEQQWVTEDGMGLLGRQNSGSADTADKQRLLDMTPGSYTGLAGQLAREI